MTSWGERLSCDLRDGVRQQAGAVELGRLVSEAVAPWVPHDGLRLAGTTPSTGLETGPVSFWHGCSPEFGRELLLGYYRASHRGELVVARGPGVRWTVADACGVPELRVMLEDQRGVWGALGLLRFDGRGFAGDDVRRAVELARELPAVLRAYVTSGPLVPEAPALPPAVLVLGPDHRVRSATAPAAAWRERLRGDQVAAPWVGEAFIEGLSLLARRGDPVVVRPSVGHGRWLAFHGQRLSRDEVAVLFEAAAGSRLLPAFCEWYGITPRERQVLADVYDGAAPKNIARRRGLSVHTVNDHLKAVFRKTGAGGRDELVTAFAG